MITSDLITLALKVAGVTSSTEPAQAGDLADGLLLLNAMLSQWQRRRFLIWRLEDYACISTGTQSYQVGPDANASSGFAVPFRPDRIEAAYARRFSVANTPNVSASYAKALLDQSGVTGDGYSSAIISNDSLPDFQAPDFSSADFVTPAGALVTTLDFPLRMIQSREDYSQISMKLLATWPACVWYDPAYPDGQAYFWPLPQADQWELHLLVKQALGQLALTDALTTPPEYIEAMSYNLARRLRPMYGLGVDASVESLALASLSAIRATNSAIPTMRLPSAIGSNPDEIYWPGMSFPTP